MGFQTMNGRDGVFHRGGCVLGCILSSLGSVRRCVIVLHENSCDVATKTGTERGVTDCVVCARATGTGVEEVATGTSVERPVTLTGCVSNSGIAFGRGRRFRGGNRSGSRGAALGSDCDYNRDTFAELGYGCVSVRSGNPPAPSRVDIGKEIWLSALSIPPSLE